MIKISRKTLLFIIGFLGIGLTALQTHFGLSVALGSVAASLGIVLTYVFFEGKLDAKAMAAQPHKWKDGKFWATLGTSLLVYVDQTFQLGLPIEAIGAIIAVAIGAIFGKKLLSPAKPY